MLPKTLWFGVVFYIVALTFVTSVSIDDANDGDDDVDELMSVSEGSEKQVPLVTYAEPEGVPNRYIVSLKKLKRRRVKEHMSDVQVRLNTMVTQRRTSMNSRMSEVKKIGKKSYYIIECSESVVEDLRSNTDVISKIEQDTIVTVNQCQCDCSSTTTTTTTTAAPPSEGCSNWDASHKDLWGLDRIDSVDNNRDNRLKVLGDGSNVDVYVVDTGIDITHPEFEGRARWGFNAAEGFDDVDAHGHGTHVAGTVGGKTYGVARKANLYAVKVLSDEGWGTVSWILEGLEYVGQRARATGRKTVINMSIGGGKSNAQNSAVDDLVKDDGVVVVVAAGNNNRNACKYSPSSAGKAISVASSRQDDRRSSFSNKGKCVDLYAPGEKILSAYPGGQEARLSGTSMASPHVAGAAAAYMSTLASNPTPAQVLQYLLDNATQDKIYKNNKNTPNLLLNVGRQC